MKKLLPLLLFAVLPLAAYLLRPTVPPMPEATALYPATDSAMILVRDAAQQTTYTTSYDPSYRQLRYPGGDVPHDRGVCSDVIVRAFRAAGIDLQKEVHNDMAAAFNVYPSLWNLKRPDPNIDHRRVANLMVFFERRDAAMGIVRSPEHFLPGDIVAWKLDNGRLHIGIVDSTTTPARTRYLVIHNIGNGTERDDALFRWEIVGHYRYFRNKGDTTAATE